MSLFGMANTTWLRHYFRTLFRIVRHFQVRLFAGIRFYVFFLLQYDIYCFISYFLVSNGATSDSIEDAC